MWITLPLCQDGLYGLECCQRCLQFWVEFGGAQIEGRLEIQPGLRVAAEVTAQTQRGVGRDAAPFEQDVVDAGGRDEQMAGQRMALMPRGPG